MKVLLIGPYPPPHGGISVHMLQVHRLLTRAGTQCAVLDTSRHRNKLRLVRELVRYALDGWGIQVHTNGHNSRSWLLVLLCGLIWRTRGTLRTVTLHSGMVPDYLGAKAWRRKLAAFTCVSYTRVVCVSPAIGDALAAAGVPDGVTDIRPAYLRPEAPSESLDGPLTTWMAHHRPLVSATLFFRPEYGFQLIVDSISRLRGLHPSIGCVVMGSGEQAEAAARQVREAGLEDHILMLGDVEHDCCLAVISRSDVFLRPTLRDGDSVSVREALALGVPVVASRVGLRPDGVILFHPGDIDEFVAKTSQALAAFETAAPLRPQRNAGRACA